MHSIWCNRNGFVVTHSFLGKMMRLQKSCCRNQFQKNLLKRNHPDFWKVKNTIWVRVVVGLGKIRTGSTRRRAKAHAIIVSCWSSASCGRRAPNPLLCIAVPSNIFKSECELLRWQLTNKSSLIMSGLNPGPFLNSCCTIKIKIEETLQSLKPIPNLETREPWRGEMRKREAGSLLQS